MITKSASDVSNCKYSYLFTKNARTAWFKTLDALSVYKNKKLTLLLPAYIGINEKEGSGVFDAVIKNGADVVFYKVTDKLQVDISDFNNKLKGNDIDVVLVIHYFGFSRVGMDSIRTICEKLNAILVEDCAHAFYINADNSKIGNYGDYSFYSLHKYLATSTGGMLKINNTSLPNPVLDVNDKIDFDALEKFASSDFKKIATIRHRNYLAYEEHLATDKNIDVLFKLESTDIPQTFAIRVKNGLREKLYFYLLEKDVPTVALYYRLIPQITENEFPNSLLISNEILNLPVHQDMKLSEVVYICEKIKEFFSNEQNRN